MNRLSSLRLRSRSDIAIYGSDGQFVAVVEVKNRADLSGDIATGLRRNLVSHGLVPSVPFFMLVSQDTGFLWAGARADDPDAPPSLEFPMKSVLERYLPDDGFEGRLGGAELTWVVYAWLSELCEKIAKPSTEPDESLAAVGFLQAIRGGRATREPVA